MRKITQILEGLQNNRINEMALAIGVHSITDVVDYLNKKIKPLFPDTYFKAVVDSFDNKSVTFTYISVADADLKKSNVAEFNASFRMHGFIDGFGTDGSILGTVALRYNISARKNKDIKSPKACKGDIDTVLPRIVKYFTDNQKVLADKTLNV